MLKSEKVAIDENIVKEVSRRMEERSTEELLKIWKENNKEEWSEEAFEAIQRILVARGESLPVQFKEEVKEKTFRDIPELYNFVLCGGISRKALNIMAFIGLFIFGWLLLMVFENLGKGKRGWWYVWPIIIAISIGRFVPFIGLLAPLIYLVGCLDANAILTHCKKLAKERIAQIESQAEVGIDTQIERGLLLHRVLRDREVAVEIFRKVLQVPGGDPFFLNLAGVVMSDNKQYQEAISFFDRVSQDAKDETLIKRATENRNYVTKRMTKQKST